MTAPRYPSRSNHFGVGYGRRAWLDGNPTRTVAGANAIAVASNETKREYVMSLGEKGIINGRISTVGAEFPISMRLPLTAIT